MRFISLKELDNSEGTVQLHAASEDGHLIYHPRPNSQDPNDPLRWPKWQKFICFFSVCAFAFMANYAVGGLAPAFYPLSIEFNKTQTETSALLLWPILALGVFNFFWVPMANYFGKRPIFVFATLLLTMAYLWGAVAQSFDSLLWSNIVAAFAGSASEALAASIVNDVFFLHQRANLMSWYMNAISGGNTIGPLLCGFVITGTSWRIFKWTAFALAGLNFLLVLLFVPETRYNRSNSGAETPDLVPSTPFSLEETHAPPTVIRPVSVDVEKTMPSSSTLEALPPNPTVPKKTTTQRLSLWSGLAPSTNLPKLFLRPLPFIAYPAVIFAFLGFAVSLAWVVALNILNSFVLQAPPYNWEPSVNGLINIPGLIGNLIGSFVGGYLVDRYSDYRAKRHPQGLFEPETRLHLLFVPALVVPAGCILWGYACARRLHWTALFFANGMVGLGLTSVPTMTMTYVSDAYFPVNADALTLVVGLKNVVAFGFLYGVVPWVQEVGYVDAFGAQAGIFVAIMALAVPLILWGRQIRHVSAGWKIVLS